MRRPRHVPARCPTHSRYEVYPCRFRPRCADECSTLAAFLLLLLTGIAALLPLRISEPRPASAPTGDFSAARAVAQLDHIAKVPHPAGSAAQADVQEYLVGELRKLGLRPEVQTRVAPSDADSPAIVGSVSNVHATIPGKKPTGRVLLVAHYDSVPIAPGAG